MINKDSHPVQVVVEKEKEERKQTRSRSWILTQSADKITFEQLQEALKNYVYIGQLEQGEKGGEQGYKHYQLYIENPEPIRWSTLKKHLPNAHIEKRQGSKQQAYAYATKAETRIDEPFGNGTIDLREESKKENSLRDIYDLIDEGASIAELRHAYRDCFNRNSKVILEYYDYTIRQTSRKTRRLALTENVYYIEGETGTGKTSYVLDKYGDENVYIMSDYPESSLGKERFDGYEGEKVILFEEFRSDIPLKRMLRYLDIYFCELPARYGNKVAQYTKVYITSNWALDEQYKHEQQAHARDWDAFKRRISSVIKMVAPKPKKKTHEQLTALGDGHVINKVF